MAWGTTPSVGIMSQSLQVSHRECHGLFCRSSGSDGSGRKSVHVPFL